MNTKHTPGPWVLFKSRKIIQVDIGYEANGTRPCVIGWPGFDSNDLPFAQNEANARLIAAAPDLLEALQELLVLYRHDTALQNGDNVVTVKAHNAIARATGAA